MRILCGGTLVIGILLGLTACDGDDIPEGLIVFDPAPVTLSGVWTGVEEIGSGDDPPFQGKGFVFPVSLVLHRDREFELRSFGFPVEGNGSGNELCRGIFATRGRTLEFFPNADCPALPLHRYTIGRFGLGGLVLTSDAGTGLIGESGGGIAIRVVIRVERD